MSHRLPPPSPTAALPTVRRRLTRVEFAQLMLDQGGRCAACHEKLRADLIVDEHLVPLEYMGSNDLSNRALYCTACARAKTEEELPDRLHGRRVRGEIGQKRRREQRRLKPRSQPRTFLTNRDGPLKRKMNGQVVRRPARRRKLRPVRVFAREADHATTGSAEKREYLRQRRLAEPLSAEIRLQIDELPAQVSMHQPAASPVPAPADGIIAVAPLLEAHKKETR